MKPLEIDNLPIFNTLIGVEVEFHLINAEGNLVNSADLILQDYEIDEHFVPELSESMIEVLSDPVSKINELSNSLLFQINKARKIAKKYGLKLLPSTPIGIELIKKRRSARYNKKNVILGEQKRDLELNICGTHIHIDKYEQDIKKQHAVMTALDPLFAFMSSSSFLYGLNTLNNYRNKIYRQEVFSEFPNYGKLLPYAKKNEDVYIRYSKLYDSWVDVCSKYGFDAEGFTKLNTCWGPIRFSQKTIESRASDTNLTSNVLALSAVYIGINRLLPKIKKIKNSYYLDDIKLPSYKTLLKYEQKIILEGLKSAEINKYLRTILVYAKKGLIDEEKKYLKPFEEMLQNNKNFADQITDFAKTTGQYDQGKITQEGARQVRQFINQKFEGDMDENTILYG